jgi:hypothetical protein
MGHARVLLDVSVIAETDSMLLLARKTAGFLAG